jgi:BRCA1-associated protein
LKFFKPSDATEFAEAYNGKPFNSMEVGEFYYILVSDIHILPVSPKYAMWFMSSP